MDRDAWNERYRGAALVWTAEPNRFLVEQVAGLAPGRVVDLAAGEGRNAVWLAEQGWQATAVDFSDVAIAKARDLATARDVEVRCAVADITDDLTGVLEPGGYDLVVVAYLQLPAPERAAALANAVAALAPGGTLLEIAHDVANLDGGYGGPQDPAVLASPGEIAGLLDGLVIETAATVERPVDTPDGPRVAIDHLVRACRPS
ncbi:MAG: class I SAM-dependent methyltransferase [Actinomycetota bacterium]